ncbi:MAG: hypothetical protein Q9180_003011 [Flavoplaca navasiana]
MAPPNATKFDLKEAKGGPSHRVAGIAIVAVFSSMVVVALGSIIVYYYTGWLDKPLSWIGLGRKAREKKHSIDVTTFHELKQRNNELINRLDIQGFSRINEGWVGSNYSMYVSTDGRVAKVAAAEHPYMVFCRRKRKVSATTPLVIFSLFGALFLSAGRN